MTFTRIQKQGLGLAAAGLMLTLASCGSRDDESSSQQLTENQVAFSVAASSAQEIPPNGSTASATGDLILDQITGELSGSITTDGIEATLAHIHQAFAGSNGEVIIGLNIDGSTISVPESTILAADQMEAMLNGSYYVNIHSVAYPAGEIRSQISGAEVEVVQVTLAGANEVPPVETDATGTGYVTLNTETGAFEVRIATSGLITPTMAHLHTAAAGENGPVVFPFEQDAAEVGNFSATGATLEADVMTSLLNGGTYINVHSAENPSGELRGQVQP